MKHALLVVSGIALGLTVALVSGGPPEAAAQAGPGPGAGTDHGAVMLGTGGGMPNQNDLCWILFKEPAMDAEGKPYERTALCLYRATQNGKGFDLMDVRELTWDPKPSQLIGPEHNARLTPEMMRKQWQAAEKKREEARRKKEEEDRRKRPRSSR